MRVEGDLEDGSWNDASLLAGLAALHCVRLARSSLPVAKQAHLCPKHCFLLSLLEWGGGGKRGGGVIGGGGIGTMMGVGEGGRRNRAGGCGG